MKKNILFGIIILAILGGIIALNLDIFSLPKGEIEKSHLEIKEEVSLTINWGENRETFKSEFKEGMTAFDLLKEKTQESELRLEAKTSEVGIFIEAIGDKENGQDGKYWLYYVNGELPMVSADKKEISPGDKIEFKFEESPF